MPVVVLISLLSVAIDRLASWPSSTVFLAICFACDQQRGEAVTPADVLALVPDLDPDAMGVEGVEALAAALDSLSPPEARPTVPVPAPAPYPDFVAAAAARSGEAA